LVLSHLHGLPSLNLKSVILVIAEKLTTAACRQRCESHPPVWRIVRDVLGH
jgi:hypothetical protein